MPGRFQDGQDTISPHAIANKSKSTNHYNCQHSPKETTTYKLYLNSPPTNLSFCSSLQEGQDIFGVDFDYEEFEKYGDEEYDDEDEEDLDEYLTDEDEAEPQRRKKKPKPKRPSKKSIFEIYEPSELKRSHFTDLDNEVRWLVFFSILKWFTHVRLNVLKRVLIWALIILATERVYSIF